MKKLWLPCILLIAAVSIVCCLWLSRSHGVSNQGGRKPIEKPKLFAHLPLTQMRQSGASIVGRLQSATIIDGYPCDASWIQFTESGRLKAFYLGDTCTIKGSRIPRGTWVRLNPDQTMKSCSFPEDTVIQGYLCNGGMGGSEGVTTSFYSNGRIASFFSAGDVVIQGIPCNGGLLHAIYLHENGALKEFTLSADTTIGGRVLSAGSKVILDEAGQVQSVTEPTIIERIGRWAGKLF